jgi:hypothetical protein
MLPSLIVAVAAFATDAQTAEADGFSNYHKTYKVEVEYWFFDTDYSFWATIFESSSFAEAELTYELLLLAKENGELNQVVGASYGRYIAVDVRLRTVYHLPQIEPSRSIKSSPLRQNLRIVQ